MSVVSCQVGIENLASNPKGSNNNWTISRIIHRKVYDILSPSDRAGTGVVIFLWDPLGALHTFNGQSLDSSWQFCCISCHVFFFSVTLCLLFSVWNQSWSKVSAACSTLCLRLTRRLFGCFHLFLLILNRTLAYWPRPGRRSESLEVEQRPTFIC